ncbi:MAG TPA: ethanolamine ammonia-lyase subunit EutC [Stellaceae bacterium]|nr:ethanolamine ammonia-lyase subunit EutC [Stellaceae bacterium]
MAQPLDPIDPAWARLRRHTPARIGLKRAGSGLATREHLSFQLAHARARDAVHDALDATPLLDGLRARGLDALHLASAAGGRRTYLLRPDLGRRLDERSRDRLDACARGHDLVLVLADGLSARAVQLHALPLIDAALPELRRQQWRIGPALVVEQGRVAIGDEIGAALDAAIVAVLIGERPGLTSPDSLGVYLTWSPAIGRQDSERNCLSNIRPEGMGYTEAAAKLVSLLAEARRRRLTGVALKDEAGSSQRGLAEGGSAALPAGESDPTSQRQDGQM